MEKNLNIKQKTAGCKGSCKQSRLFVTD